MTNSDARTLHRRQTIAGLIFIVTFIGGLAALMFVISALLGVAGVDGG